MENNLSIVKDQFKELPNNIEAEQAVIGSILVDNEILDEISVIIKGDNFFDPMHQKIFEAIVNLFNNSKPVDILTVSEELLQVRQFQDQ